MKKPHHKLGQYTRVADHLYRYSATKKYCAVFKFGGKTKWVSLKTTDRELAGRRLKEEMAKYKRTDATASGMKLEALLKLYEQSIQGLAEHTQATRNSILKIFRESWKPGLDLKVSDITKGQLQIWLSEQRQRLKGSSYNEYIRFVRNIFVVALNHKVIGESPAAEFKQVRVEKPIRSTPTWEQFQAIVADIRTRSVTYQRKSTTKATTATIGDPETADLVEFMGRAGVGTAECANLLGEHIDFANDRITLYREKTDVGYTIPIFPQVRELLERMKTEDRIAVGQPVFRVKDPKKSLGSACKRLKCEHFSSRAMRRCFITRAIERGVDFKTISAWQGHQDGGVLIAKTYSHLRNEHADNMAKKLIG